MTKTIYFVRHGETEWNAIRRMQGQWNSDLNERGRRQAEVNGQLLARLEIDALFASPLDRTRQTADIINRFLDLPITFDARLMEWDCGDWSGHLYAEVAEKWPNEWAALQADRFHFRGPACENYPDMIARAAPLLESIVSMTESNIAIVSHGMIGKAMISHLMGLDPTTTLALDQDNDLIMALLLQEDGWAAVHYKGGVGPFEGLVYHEAATIA
ncbi:MAG: histidine phosphatase family protein [Pseudomonadota bacterium]